MSKSVVLTLESRFMDEYGEYANLPVFNAHGGIVGYVGGEVPESGNPCEFNRLDDEGFTYCASATEVVRLKAENAKLRELVCHLWYVKPRGVTSVLVEGKLVDLEELMESVGLRWEDA